MSALGLAPEKQGDFVAEACAGDDALDAEVRAMLAAHRAAGEFLQAPAPDLETQLSRFKAEEAETRIGPYKLREQIGEGGFGTVWVAEQEQPVRRRVALKIIKLGMDTKEVIARFEQERQALAMMDHPNIAKVLDAGATTTGRPYFVMELVRGVKITDYCDAQHLSMQERLVLFITVCQAVQHAHQKGIIHRDLKPSNILVTVNDGAAVPKVIDFGVAKATQGRLVEHTVYTQFQQMIGTPLYMSPEQADMTSLDVDTRSDIYSLGVLLYELLTGRTPIDAEAMRQAGLDEMRRIIREVEPPRPSTRLRTLVGDELTATAKRRHTEPAKLPGSLSGDLDWIVMKCLEKDRRRRYDTANGLALDLQRHLKNEVITARPPTLAYLLGKLVRRHKLAFAAAGAVLAALLLGLVISVWQAVRATRASEAEARQRIAAQAAQAQATESQKKAEAEKQRADEQLARSQWLLYAGKLTLAQVDFEMGEGRMAAHYLSECPENLRGWEHRYLSTRIQAKSTLTGHSAEVFSIAFSADGQRMVSGGQDGTAKVWDVATGRELLNVPSHRKDVHSVAFSPDGQHIVTGSGDWPPGEGPGEATVWNAVTGERVWELKDRKQSVWAVAFSPDGKYIATGTCAKAPETGETTIWDAKTGHPLLTLPSYAVNIRCVTFSADSRRLATATQFGGVAVWEVATGRQLFMLEHLQHLVSSVAFSPDGRKLVVVANLSATIWEIETRQALVTLKGHSHWVMSAAFSPDGRRVATGAWDCTTKLWDASSGDELFTLKGHLEPVRCVAFSGDRLATASNDHTIKFWDAVEGQKTPTFKGHADAITSVAFSPDSKRVVTAGQDCTARIWEAATSREKHVFKLHPDAPHAGWTVAGVWAAAFSANGQRVATASQDKVVKVWDAATEGEPLVIKPPDFVRGVAFSPDGKRLLGGCFDDTAKLWDTETGREVFSFKGHTGDVYGVAFSPDGRTILTGSWDHTAKLWDAATRRELHSLEGHTGPIEGVAFSADGLRVATASMDRTAKIWEVATGRELLTLRGHTMPVVAVAFHPDGQRIVTGSSDQSAKIWETGTGLEVFSFKHKTAVSSAAFSPDGHRLVTGIDGAAPIAYIWSAQ